MTTFCTIVALHVVVANGKKKNTLCLCSQVYPDPSRQRQREVQPDYVVLGGGAWHLCPQPCRLSLFSEGAGRHPQGDLVCVAG